MESDRRKVYVEVNVTHRPDGTARPNFIKFENDEKYEIDRVSDIRQAPALKAGGQGDRYTIWIGGHQSYLFFERSADLAGNNIGRWFVERRHSVKWF